MATFKRASQVLVNNSGHLYEKNFSLGLRLNPKLNSGCGRANEWSLQITTRQKATDSGASGKSAAKPEKPAPKGTPYKNLTIGVPRESYTNEKRVAITPAVTQTLTKKGFKLIIEENAGQQAKFPNDDYEKAGAKITNLAQIYANSDLLLKVRAPTINVSYTSFAISVARSRS